MSEIKLSRDKKEINIIKPVLAGFVISVLLFLALTFSFAFLVLKDDISSDAWLPCELLFGAVSGLTGGFVSVRLVMHKALLISLTCGVMSALTVFSALMISNKGNVGLNSLILVGVLALFSLIGGIIAVTVDKKKRYRLK